MSAWFLDQTPQWLYTVDRRKPPLYQSGKLVGTKRCGVHPLRITSLEALAGGVPFGLFS